MSSRVHIVGAGLAGLAAAVRLKHLGPAVTLYEAAPRAGGRCRSYHDPQLGCVIDNGNHLLLSGNSSAMVYLAEIGAGDRVVGPESASFDFLDVRSGLRWSVKPGPGAVPWWILDARRRVPDTSLADYWSIVRLLRAGPQATVSDCIDPRSVLFSRFWEPLTLAVLNTAPRDGSAMLMQAVLRETVAKGADACRPLIARDSLAEALVDPAVATLERAGVNLRTSTRVTAIATRGTRAMSLTVDGAEITLGIDDVLIFAGPAWIATELLPGLTVPPAGEPIVNVHYRLSSAPSTVPRIVGLVGGLSQWVFLRGDIASVTISGATAEAELSAEDIAARCWPEVGAALQLDRTLPDLGFPTGGLGARTLSEWLPNSCELPPYRVIKERRATPAQTPAAVAQRPRAASAYDNLLLAGDWTDTGLPATIEGAVRSGFTAAQLAQQRMANLQRGAA